MLEEEELKDAVLMVFANKQDLPNALATDAIAEKLGLSVLKQRQWAIRHIYICIIYVHFHIYICLKALKQRQWAIFKTSAIKGVYDICMCV